MTQLFGLFDTEDELWMGDDDGPVIYNSEIIAKISARVLDERLGQTPGRTQPRLYDPNPKHKVDEVTANMDSLEALRRIEGTVHQPTEEHEATYDERTITWRNNVKLVN